MFNIGNIINPYNEEINKIFKDFTREELVAILFKEGNLTLEDILKKSIEEKNDYANKQYDKRRLYNANKNNH